MKTESDTPPQEHGESQNGGCICGNHPFFKFLLIVFLLAPLLTAHAASPEPNFIVISIDDLVYAEIGPIGSTLNRTPIWNAWIESGANLPPSTPLLCVRLLAPHS